MFKQWVLSLPKRDPNFYLMDGGKFYIPQRLRETFLENYLAALKSNEDVFCLEKVGGWFKFFLDIDTSLTDEKLNEIIKDEDVFVLKCKVKMSYHIIFEKKIVNKKEASAKATELKKKYSSIDSSVYNSSLRMIGS
jgi:hypothetical protein